MLAGSLLLPSLLLILLVFLNIPHGPHNHSMYVRGATIQSKFVYVWGRNKDSECGIKTMGTASTPLQNTLLRRWLVDSSSSWLEATGVTASDVQVNVNQIVKADVRFYLLDYTNTTDGSWLGQKMFVSGYNGNGIGAVISPPYLMSEPELLYAYGAGKASNPLASRNITQVACVDSCLALTSDGLVFYHQGESSGNGDWTKINLPTSIIDPDNSSNTIQNITYTMVGVGGIYAYHTYFALSNYGYVFSWGAYNSGLRASSLASPGSSTGPAMIPSLRNISQIAAGKYVAGAISSSGTLYTWGSNLYGAMGVGNATLSNSEIPLIVDFGGSPITQAVFGDYHGIVFNSTGSISGFGRNNNGQADPSKLGINQYSPSLHTASNPQKCFASSDASGCIMSDGLFYTWGSSALTGTNLNAYTAVNTNGEQVKTVDFSFTSALVITTNGNISVWGENYNGGLAIGDVKSVRYPKQLNISSLLSPNVTVLKLVSGLGCNFMLSSSSSFSSNSLDYWGQCLYGLQFSNGAVIPASAPSSFTNLGIVDVSSVLTFALALTTNGDVYAWGSSTASLPFGYPSGTYSTPVLLVSDAAIIGAGSFHSLILLKNGTLLGCGDNSKGELTLSNFTDPQPLQPMNTSFLQYTGEKIIQLQGGSLVSYILTDLGNVYGCGDNSINLLASSGSFFPYFIRLNGALKIRKIASGFYTAPIFISYDGTAWYFKLSLQQFNLPANDSFVIDAFCGGMAYYLITQKGNVYTQGSSNLYYEVDPTKGKVSVASPTLYTTKDVLGGIPYTGSASSNSGGRATLAVAEEWSCFGTNATNSSVCSSNGFCSAPDQCTCKWGFYGSDCSLWNCNGISSTNVSFVCGGKGVCTAPDQCSCSNVATGQFCGIDICFGLAGNNTSVCGGRGNCTGFNSCSCNSGYYGPQCEYKSCFSSIPSISTGRKFAAERLCTKINKFIL